MLYTVSGVPNKAVKKISSEGNMHVRQVAHRVVKSDVTNISTCEIMGFDETVQKKIIMTNVFLSKISLLLPFGDEVLALLCSGDTMQNRL